MPRIAASCFVAERQTPAKAVRIAVVGVSEGLVCGVRDYAGVLTEALGAQGASTTTHWLTRSHCSAAASRAEIAAWSAALEGELREEPPDAVLFHYSVFAYSYRGLPVFVPRVLRALRAGGAPVISELHEVAYPFRHRGWRAKLWAVSQRFLLISVMRASAAVVVTADFRAAWLASRRWLPKRPVALTPVHSGLPAPLSRFTDNGAAPKLGLFGYAYQGACVSLVLDALRTLRDSRPEAQLVLLGAPGADSAVGEEWVAGARARGVADALSFSGTLSAQALSDAIAASELLLFADETGPASRKSSLAAALASGRPVVAIDGPRRWQELVDAGALSLAAPAPAAIARAVRALLDDPAQRDALGARGRRFAEERMSPAAAARAILDLFEQLPARR
jgi:glycosyltransferase involved in cell wall biosynthesis